MTASSQQYCLRWNNHRSNLLNVFDELLQNGAFTDVTIAVDCGRTIKCHKIVLAACSSYFQTLFLDLPDRNGAIHPIVVLKDVRFSEIKAILEYMYRGEVNVAQDQLSSLLKVAEVLKVKGLVEENAGSKGESRSAQDFRRREEDAPLEMSSPSSSSIVQSSGHVASPPHSSIDTYREIPSLYTVGRHGAHPYSMWTSSPSLPLSQSSHQPSKHSASSTLGGSYGDSYEMSSHKRTRKSMQSGRLDEKESILRKVLDVPHNVTHADSSQGILLVQSDSHDSIHYRSICGIGSENSNNRRIDLPREVVESSPYTDEDEIQPSPQSAGEILPKSGIASHPPAQPKPEWKRYKQYTRQDIMSAISEVERGMSAVQAARKYGVPSRTLYDKVKKLGIQTSRPPKRTLATNGASTAWYGVAGNPNGGIYNSVQPEAENENSNAAESMVNTSAATTALLETIYPKTIAKINYPNPTAQDRDSTSDTTIRSDQSPVICCAKPKQQSVDDEVEDLSVSRKSDIPVIVQSHTAASDAVTGERIDSESDNSD